jgi:hypothetical protein
MTSVGIPNGQMLADILRDPVGAKQISARQWGGIISIARSELLLSTLAHRLRGLDLPSDIAHVIADAKIDAQYQRRSALWEADCALRALSDYNGKVILMKGTAYAAAGLKAGEGRYIGDLDIMVAQVDIDQVEGLLLTQGGWEWVKEDAYDDAYYRDHMHELPPMIHKERDRMIDVHHTILPKTARPNPHAAAMIDAAVRLNNSLYILAPADMVCHCAAHLIADGDMTGGMRNIWDMHCLLQEFASDDDQFWPGLATRAAHHGLTRDVQRAVRLSARLYGTKIPANWDERSPTDALFIKRVVARDQWGRGSAKFIRLCFYIRSHWLRMPPMMLAKHLWTKWRK